MAPNKNLNRVMETETISTNGRFRKALRVGKTFKIGGML